LTIDKDKQLWRTGSINPRCANFFCLWLVMWSNPKYRNSNARKSAESKKKPVVFSRKQRVLWSCYPDLNWRPHPYQLIPHPRNASIWRSGGIFVPESRRQWCFPLHCLRPLVSYFGSGCGSPPMHSPAGGRTRSPPPGIQNRTLSKSPWPVSPNTFYCLFTFSIDLSNPLETQYDIG